MSEKNSSLSPSPGLLCKLGSIIIHSEEFSSLTGHPFDELELKNLLRDPDVVDWLEGMRELALIPEKR